MAPIVVITEEKLFVDLEDGRSLIIPLNWYPRLLHGTTAERQNWQLLGDGYAIEWPDLCQPEPKMGHFFVNGWHFRLAQ